MEFCFVLAFLLSVPIVAVAAAAFAKMSLRRFSPTRTTRGPRPCAQTPRTPSISSFYFQPGAFLLPFPLSVPPAALSARAPSPFAPAARASFFKSRRQPPRTTPEGCVRVRKQVCARGARRGVRQTPSHRQRLVLRSPIPRPEPPGSAGAPPCAALCLPARPLLAAPQRPQPKCRSPVAPAHDAERRA